MVTFTAADDRRQSYKANQSRRAVNAARQHKATFGDPNWIMSQSPETMKNRDFMSKAKPAMVAMQGNRDFLTTDKDEERNLYQMWMNQMKGGDKGARMLDTRGLPAGARRIGRTLFTDPAKSQGFFGDVGSLFSGKNKAAVRAKEYNPFPKAGFGEQFYKDQFPWESSFGNLMGLAEKSPTLSMLAGLFPKKERIPLERDLSWVPENVGAYNEIPEIPFMGEFEEEGVDNEFNWMDPFLENSQIPPQFNIQKLRDEGRSGYINPGDNIPSVIDEDITDKIVIKEKPDRDEEVIISEDSFIEPEDSFIESLDEGESFNNQYSFVNEVEHFDSPYDYIMELKGRFDNLDIDSIIQNAILNGIIVENE